ncbi:MAG: hypothetical protein U1F68_18950 [Gammaproteobacteria bacterium]
MDDVKKALEKQGVGAEPSQGDVVLVRTGFNLEELFGRSRFAY